MKSQGEALRLDIPTHENREQRSMSYFKALGKCMLYERGFRQLEKTVERAATDARLKGGYVCLPIDLDRDDLVGIHAAPFSAHRRVDHVWGDRADIYFLDRENIRNSSRLHVEADSGTVEVEQLSRRNIAGITCFLQAHQNKAVVSTDIIEDIAYRESQIYQKLQVEADPIISF